MYKADSRKIGIFLTGFILLAWMAILPSLCAAGMHELSDRDMGDVYAAGFSSFDLNTTTGIARIDLNTVTLSTYTTIDTLKMGYYTKGTLGWDNAWTSVSLGTASNDLVLSGLYIEAKFTDITNGSGNRQLEYLRIGTNSMTGTISANFASFSGTLDNGGTTYTRDTSFGTTTITSNGGFYLSLDRTGTNGDPMGYSFHWVNASKP